MGLRIDDPVWDHSAFSKNRDRLQEGDIAAGFLAAMLAEPRVKRLRSSEHFSVDGTLVEAWASMKSFKPRAGTDADDEDRGGRKALADFRGQKRSNETHVSTTDPDALLYRKGPGMAARLCVIGHGLMENRPGLIVDARLTRDAGWRLAQRGYDAADFVEELRTLNVRPHVAQNTSGRRSAIDRRTTRHPGYAASQRIRKRIEEAFGWVKTGAGMKRARLRGLDRVGWAFPFAGAAYNLIGLTKLLTASP